VGRNMPLGSDLGTAALRFATLYAPRYAEADAIERLLAEAGGYGNIAEVVPRDTAFLGLAASLVRGQLGVPRLDAGTISYLLDGSLGYLPLQQSLGWWASLGLAIPVWGGDIVSISARAGNVLGGVPGLGVFGLSADYAVSQW
jgi:hypothetical protein